MRYHEAYHVAIVPGDHYRHSRLMLSDILVSASGLLRGRAAEVLEATRKLFDTRGGNNLNTLMILEPLVGLPVAIAPGIDADGEMIGVLTANWASAEGADAPAGKPTSGRPTKAATTASGPGMGLAAGRGAKAPQAAAARSQPAAIASSAANHRSPAFVASLPDDTPISWAANPKSGQCRGRYETYSKSTTLGERRALACRPDFKYDIEHGFMHIGDAVRGVNKLTGGEQHPPGEQLKGGAEVPLDSPLDLRSIEALEEGNGPPRADSRVNSSFIDAYIASSDRSGAARLLGKFDGMQGTCAVAGDNLAGDYGDPDDGSPGGVKANWGAVLLALDNRKITSVMAAKRSEHWLVDGGFCDATRKELDRVVNKFKTLAYVRADEVGEMVARYGRPKVILLAMVVPYRIKYGPNGELIKYACRMTAADTKNYGDTVDTFSACVAPDTVRLMVQLHLNMPGSSISSEDVEAANYRGTPTPPEEPGGRVVFLHIPPGLEEFGFPSVDAEGRKMMFRVNGNMPGLNDAGKTWERTYTAFFIEHGFKQSVVDRRVFYCRNDGLRVACVLVDDRFFFTTHQPTLDTFLKAWSDVFESSIGTRKPGVLDFGGVTYTRIGDTMELSSDRLIDDLAERLVAYPLPPHSKADSPLSLDKFSELRDEVIGIENPTYGPQMVQEAQGLLGLAGFLSNTIKPDGLTAYSVLSQKVGHYLTRAVWDTLVRFCHYIVQSKRHRLTLHKAPRRGPQDKGADSLVMYVDSSCINGSEGESRAGYVLTTAVPGVSYGGAIMARSMNPRKLGTSSAAAELVAASEVAKEVEAYRILLRELGLCPEGPTDVYMDAQAVLAGTNAGEGQPVDALHGGALRHPSPRSYCRYAPAP